VLFHSYVVIAMLRELAALSLLVGVIGLSGHALACTDKTGEAVYRADSILSKYKQIFREREAVSKGSKPSRRNFCRLTREMAELEREWLDSLKVVKYSCPALYDEFRSSNAYTVSTFETNYELSQKIIGLCAQADM
jgi:hypothetical protein